MGTYLLHKRSNTVQRDVEDGKTSNTTPSRNLLFETVARYGVLKITRIWPIQLHCHLIGKISQTCEKYEFESHQCSIFSPYYLIMSKKVKIELFHESGVQIPHGPLLFHF